MALNSGLIGEDVTVIDEITGEETSAIVVSEPFVTYATSVEIVVVYSNNPTPCVVPLKWIRVG